MANYSFPNQINLENPTAEEVHSCAVPEYDNLFSRPYYKDLRSLEDDKTVLKNPHKGWYWHYIDNGYKRANYRANHDPNDHLEDFPGLNHLYLRYDWGDIEVEEGKYDWSYIDKIMDEWSKYGYRFGMRICTYEGDGNIPFATPEYVFKKGARVFELPGGRLEPDYGDPIYLDALTRFMEEAGKKFNGDPRLELIDVGTYGTWGEGHTGNGSERLYSNDVMKKHIDLHVRNFPDTFIMLNDDHINARWPAGIRENLELVDYAASLGLGLDDDSVCVRHYFLHCGYNTLRTPWLFDRLWENAPVVLEFEHYTGVAPEVFRSGYPFVDAMRRTHATFGGFHGYPRPWLQREPYLTEYAANHLGYWYFLPGAEVAPLALDAPNMVKLFIENRGFSHAYRPCSLKIKLTGENGQTFVQTVSPADCRSWEPGKITEQKATLRPTGICPGLYDFSIGLFENDTPIRWGLKPAMDAEGFYPLFQIPVRSLND